MYLFSYIVYFLTNMFYLFRCLKNKIKYIEYYIYFLKVTFFGVYTFKYRQSSVPICPNLLTCKHIGGFSVASKISFQESAGCGFLKIK